MGVAAGSATRAARPAPLGIPWQLYASSFVTTGLAGLVGVTAPGLRETFDVGYVAIGALFVVQTLGGLVGALGVGVWRHRALELPVLALVAAAALAVGAASPVFGVLLVAMIAAGFAGYALVTRAQADLSRIAGSRRGHALSLQHVCGAVGATVFPLGLTALLLLDLDWRSGFVLLAGFYAIYHVATRGLPPGEQSPGLRPGGHIAVRTRWSATIAVLAMGVQTSVPLWLPVLLHDDFDLSQAMASAGAGVYFLALLVGRVGGARLLARLGERRELWLCIGLVLGGYLVLGLAPSAELVVAGAALIAAGVGPLLPLGVSRTVAASGDDRLASSLVMGLGQVSQIALPGLVVALLLVIDLHAALTATVLAGLVIAVAIHRSDPGGQTVRVVP
jgi:MFS family permease